MARTKQSCKIKGDASDECLQAAKKIAAQKKRRQEQIMEKQLKADLKSHRNKRLNNWKEPDMAKALQYEINQRSPGKLVRFLSFSGAVCI